MTRILTFFAATSLLAGAAFTDVKIALLFR
jgi:hypothetical protein